jgi:hypothetical protein
MIVLVNDNVYMDNLPNAKNIQYISKLVKTKEVEFHCLITFPKNKTL